MVKGKLEDAIRELRRLSGGVRYELSKRRRDGPKPSEKRRNKRYFAASHPFWYWRDRGDDALEQARRDQEMFTSRAAGAEGARK